MKNVLNNLKNLSITMMDKDDIDEILEISSKSFHISWSRNSYENELINPNATYFIAKFDNKVIGFAGTWIILDESQITNIAVDPNFRNNKVASKLLETLILYCSKKGCTSFTLEVRENNEPAKNLYMNHGFKIEGLRKGYYQDNKENALIMQKREIV